MAAEPGSMEKLGYKNVAERTECEKSLVQKLTRFAWLPIPLLFLLMLVLSLGPVGPDLGLVPLLPVFNFIFLTLVCLLVAVLAARSYLVKGYPTILFMGAGTLAFGVTAMLASLPVPGGDYNTGNTTWYLGIALAGFLCLLSAFWLVAPIGRRFSRPSRPILVATYSAAILAITAINLSASHGLLPTFYVVGVGPTVLRYTVLGIGFMEFAGTSLLILLTERHNRSTFLHWYALGLALNMVGQFGAINFNHSWGYDSLHNWVANACIYLGGIYLLIAVTVATRQSGNWTIPITTLRETYDRYMRLVDASPDAVLVLAENRVAFANPAASRLFGVSTPELLLGLQLLDLVHPASCSGVENYLRSSLSGEKAAALDVKVLRQGWSAVDVELAAVPVTDEGRPAIQVVLRDITERKRAEEKIRRSEAQLKEAQRLSKVGSWEWTIDGDVVTWSDELYDIAGLSRERPAPNNKEHPDFYTPESWALLDRAVANALEKGEPYELTLEMVRVDGAHRWLNAHGGVIRDARGQITGLRGTVQDITERKRAEDALRESEACLARSQAIARLASWEMDVSTRRLSGSEELYRMFNIGPDTTLDDFFEKFHPEDLDRVKEAAMAAIYYGKPYNIDYRFVPRPGEVRYAQSEGETRYDGEGKPISIFGTAQDITERKMAEEALRESEEKFRALSETSLAMILMHQGDRFLYVNSTCEQITGYSRDELLKMHFWDLVHPEFRELVKERGLARQRGEEVPSTYEFKILAKDGLERWVDMRARLIDYGGRPTVITTLFDITERKRLEEALRDRERQLESRLEAILSPEDTTEKTIAEIVDLPMMQDMAEAIYAMTGVGIWLLDLKGKVLVSAGWQDICTKFHRSHPETCMNCVESDLHLSGKVEEGKYVLYKCKNGMWDVITPVIVNGRHIANLYSGQFFFEDEVPDYDFFAGQADRYGFNRDDYLAAVDRAPRQSREKVRSVLGFYTQIAGVISKLSYSNVQLARLLTRQRESEEALRESEDRFKAIFNRAALGLAITDPVGLVLDCNPAYAEMLGYCKEDVKIKRFLDITHPDDVGRNREFQQQMNDGLIDSYQIEKRYIRKDGQVIWCNVVASAIRNPDGSLKYNMAVVEDITERKRAEKELAKAKAQAELYLDLMGHDINNMNMISAGFLELAKNLVESGGSLDSSKMDLLDGAMTSIDNSSRLIGNVRRLQRMRSGECKTEVYDLGELIEGVCGEFKPTPDHYVHIACGAVKGIRVEANELLKEVFANLIGNAIKHSHGPAYVNIRMNRENVDGRRYCRVSIDDNGPGIPDNMKGVIFDRFRRGDTKAHGTGLGLYLVKTLVDSYGGLVWVEDRVPGDHTKGARFVVMLPAVE